MSRRRPLSSLAPLASFASLVTAVSLALLADGCGARTGLPDIDASAPPSELGGSGGGAGSPPDAGHDADASHDADSGHDAEAGHDAAPDVTKSDCLGPNATWIYLITTNDELLAYDPGTGSLKMIAVVDCPSGGATPFSMAVDRKGIAYSVFNDGRLFKIRTSNGQCQATSFEPGQEGLQTFGMGYSTNEGGPAETLFVVSDGFAGEGATLASIDTGSFVLSPINPVSPPLNGMELTGTGDGRLYGFAAVPGAGGARLVRIDKLSGELTTETELPGLGLGSGWAFAFWGGDFYFFTAPGGSTVITRYSPADGSVKTVTQIPYLVVGAGVSTCAPEQ